MVSDPKGNVVERGKHPRTSPTSVTCAVSKDITADFKDKQTISLTFRPEGTAPLLFECGEKRLRTESHLNKVCSCAG